MRTSTKTSLVSYEVSVIALRVTVFCIFFFLPSLPCSFTFVPVPRGCGLFVTFRTQPCPCPKWPRGPLGSAGTGVAAPGRLRPVREAACEHLGVCFALQRTQSWHPCHGRGGDPPGRVGPRCEASHRPSGGLQGPHGSPRHG